MRSGRAAGSSQDRRLGRLAVRALVDGAGHELRAAHLDQHPRRDPHRDARASAGRGPSRSGSRLSERSASTREVRWIDGPVEARRLEHEAGGRGGDLDVGRAHHARDDRGLLGVGDDEHVGVERALDVVEGRHLLARRGAAHDDLRAAQLLGVERVQRLTGEQHHVVGDVDDVVDRAHARSARAAP